MHVMHGWWPPPFGYRSQLKERTLTTPYALFYNERCMHNAARCSFVKDNPLRHNGQQLTEWAEWFTLYKRNINKSGVQMPPKSYLHSHINEHVVMCEVGLLPLHVLNAKPDFVAFLVHPAYKEYEVVASTAAAEDCGSGGGVAVKHGTVGKGPVVGMVQVSSIQNPRLTCRRAPLQRRCA